MKENIGEGRQGYSLSPELAVENSELYKTELLRTLQEKSHLSHVFYERLLNEGKIKKVDIDTKSELSRSTETGIILGSIPLSQTLKENILFEDITFNDYPLEKAYIFSHEISHKVAAEIGSSDEKGKFNNLYNAVIQSREKNGKGFSGLGSLDFYKKKKGQKTPAMRQATEDIVELTNMYLWDPEYLQRFLAFLGDKNFNATREPLGLCSISKKTQGHLFSIISESVEQLVRRKEE